MKKLLFAALLGLAPTSAFALTPTAPTAVVVTNVSPTEQHVCWTDNANNEDGFTARHVATGNSFTLPSNTLCQNFTGLLPNTLHNYQISAFITAGTSGQAAGSGTTPPAGGPVAWVDPTNGNVPVPRGFKPKCITGQNPAVDFCSADRGRWQAFPSARGWGAYASPLRNEDGTWNYTIKKVKNGNDTGADSYRTAVTATGPRLVYFEYTGDITINSDLLIKDAGQSRVFIAGSTSPGGVQFKSGPAAISGPQRSVRIKDMVVEGIKSRPGILHAPSTNVQGFAYTGQIVSGAWASSDIIVDHVTANWSTDEVFAFTGVDNATLQWSITAEPISCGPCRDDGNAQHDFSGAFIVTNNRVTVANNLIMSGLKRMPNIAGNSADVINNVIYNEGFLGGVMYTGTYAAGANNSTIVNYAGNWFAHGPRTTNQNSPAPVPAQKPYCMTIAREGTQAPGAKAEFYGAGNICPHDLTGLANGDIAFIDPVNTPTNSPVIFSTPRGLGLSMTPIDATLALKQVLNHAGARQDAATGIPRADTVEQRSVDQVRNCDNHTYTPAPGRITAVPAPGYPNLLAAATWTVPADVDNDGMADWWELQYFGNLTHPHTEDFDGDGWSNGEEYIFFLKGEHLPLLETGSIPAPNCSWPAQ